MMSSRQRYRSQVADRFRDYTGRSHVVFTGRGATAIWAALKAFDFSDQPVLIPANTCYIVLWAILLSGNRPMLVDIDPDTGMITPETLSATGIEQPAAVIPCHLYGLPAPMPEIVAWARERGAKVIEDAAQAVIRPERKIGSWGDCSIFSFGAGKIIDIGWRGALLCSDAALAGEIRRWLAPLPLFDEGLEALQDQWSDIYWATHQHEADNPRIAELYPKLFDLYQPITLYNASAQGFAALASRFHTLPSALEHRLRYTRTYEQIVDSVFRALAHTDAEGLWRFPLLVPPEIRDDLFRHLLGRFYDVTRWYPSLQSMARALRPDLQQPATPHAGDFARRIINLPLHERSGEPRELLAQAISLYRNWKKL